jgi:hypothetical protein
VRQPKIGILFNSSAWIMACSCRNRCPARPWLNLPFARCEHINSAKNSHSNLSYFNGIQVDNRPIPAVDFERCPFPNITVPGLQWLPILHVARPSLVH